MEEVPLCRGLVIRKATRGSVEIAVVLRKRSWSDGSEAAVVMIGWVSDPGVAGFADLPMDFFRRGIWRAATAADAEIARRHLAAPDVDRHGVSRTRPEAVVLTEAMGPALTGPIVQPWDEEAQRIVEMSLNGART